MSFSMTTGAIVAAKRLVKMSGANVIHNTATATDDPIGVTETYGASGDVIAINGLCGEEPIEMTAGGVFAAGAILYAAADGKVTGEPAGNGTYRKVGYAIEASAADGDIVLVLPCNDGTTHTNP